MSMWATPPVTDPGSGGVHQKTGGDRPPGLSTDPKGSTDVRLGSQQRLAVLPATFLVD